MRDYAKYRIMRLRRYVEKMSLCNYHNAYYGQEVKKNSITECVSDRIEIRLRNRDSYGQTSF